MKGIWLSFLPMLFIYKCLGRNMVAVRFKHWRTIPGTLFGRNQFPFYVQLIFDNVTIQDNLPFRCGGSLIHWNYVLSVATCIMYAASNDTNKIEQKLIREKKLKIYAGTDVAEGADSTKYVPLKIILHESYQYLDFVDNINDIAIIRVMNESAVSPYISLITLPSVSAKRCDEGIITGYYFPQKCTLLQYGSIKLVKDKDLNENGECPFHKEHLYSATSYFGSLGAPYFCYINRTVPVQWGVYLNIFGCPNSTGYVTMEDIKPHLDFINKTIHQKPKKRTRLEGPKQINFNNL